MRMPMTMATKHNGVTIDADVQMFVTTVDGNGDTFVQWSEYWEALKAHALAAP